MLKKICFSLLFGTFFLILHAQDFLKEVPSDMIWKRKITIDSTIIPAWITSANLDGNALIFPGNNSDIHLLLEGKAPFYPVVYSRQLYHLDSSGSVSKVSDKKLDEIFENHECIDSYKGSENLYFLIYDTISWIDKNGKFNIKKLDSGTIMELPDNHQLLVTANDSPHVILKTKIPISSEHSILLYETENFDQLLKSVVLPISSTILNESVLRSNATHIALMQNNTILKGPDHHDINIYMVDKSLNKVWEKHITGKSELGKIWGHDMVMDSAGCVIVIGFADDNFITFRDSNYYDQIFPEFTPDTKPFYFIATYNKEGVLIQLYKFLAEMDYIYDTNRFKILSIDKENNMIFYNKWKEELYVFNTKYIKLNKLNLIADSIPPKVSSKYFLFTDSRTFYYVKVIAGELNTSNAPVFEIEKRIIPYEYFW